MLRSKGGGNKMPSVAYSTSPVGGPGPDRDEVLENALRMHAMGFALVAGPGVAWGVCGCRLAESCNAAGKHPWGGWGNTKRKVLSREEILWTWSANRNMEIWPNLFIVCYLSQIVAADIDDMAIWETVKQSYDVPPTLRVRTGSGKEHLLYRRKWDTKSKNPPMLSSSLPLGAGDIRWKAVVVAPGSRHASGGKYEFIEPIVAPAEAPGWLGAEKPKPVVAFPESQGAVGSPEWNRWMVWQRGVIAHDIQQFGLIMQTFAENQEYKPQRPIRGFAIAARCGALIHMGVISRTWAQDALMEAAQHNGWVEDYGSDDVLRQIGNGIDLGIYEAGGTVVRDN